MNLLIRGDTVYDGIGSEPFKCDIIVEDGLIAEMGPNLTGKYNGKIIEGKTVCPGFIDIHRHADIAVFTLPEFGKTELLQGITSIVSGNCGLSPLPGNHPWHNDYLQYIEPVTGPVLSGFPDIALEEPNSFRSYRESLEKHPLPVNFGFMAGAGAIKTAVKGFSKSAFTPREMIQAQNHIGDAFGAGALGLSFGLMYKPECYSSHDELAALARFAGDFSGVLGTILCFHIRGEGGSLVESVDEVIRLAQKADLPVHISHFKSTGISNWRNLIYRAIEKIETARRSGLDITADFYPYDGGSTTILSLIPPPVQEGSIKNLCARLEGKKGKDLLARELNNTHPGWDNMALSIGWDRIIISSVCLPEHGKYCGRSMAAIAGEEGFDDPVELLAELVSGEEGKVGIIVLSMDPKDIDTVAVLPWTFLISDSLYGASSSPHPRLNGAFPKFCREYAFERKIISMEKAVKKMTSMPAQRMGLSNRGKLQKGCAADILVFDPEKFTDNADYSNSTALASGMETVIINGKIACNQGVFYDPAGCFICRTG